MTCTEILLKHLTSRILWLCPVIHVCVDGDHAAVSSGLICDSHLCWWWPCCCVIKPYLSFTFVLMVTMLPCHQAFFMIYVCVDSDSPDVTPSGWQGWKHQLTNCWWWPCYCAIWPYLWFTIALMVTMLLCHQWLFVIHGCVDGDTTSNMAILRGLCIPWWNSMLVYEMLQSPSKNGWILPWAYAVGPLWSVTELHGDWLPWCFSYSHVGGASRWLSAGPDRCVNLTLAAVICFKHNHLLACSTHSILVCLHTDCIPWL